MPTDQDCICEQMIISDGTWEIIRVSMAVNRLCPLHGARHRAPWRDTVTLAAAIDTALALAKDMETTYAGRKDSSFYKGHASGLRSAGCLIREVINEALEGAK